MTKNYVHHTASRRPDMTAQLHKAGVDTDGFLSLRLHQSLIPEGAELIIQIRDKKTGARFTLNLNDDDDRIFGKNSRFYGQMMADGHVFNPYIHRRFIASQFHRLVVRHGIDGIRDAVAREYDWKYAIEQIRKEAHKLANPERHDKTAFAERSMFFSLNAIGAILSDYVSAVHKEIDDAAASAGKRGGYAFIRGYGRVEQNHIRPMKYRFTKLVTEAAACRAYAELDKLLENFDFIELDRRTRLPESFVTPYINAGAFYTLKNAIMFENKRLYVTIEETDRGSVHATCVHHDGRNHFDVYRLSERGKAWYENHGDYLDWQTICETLVKPYNRRAPHLRKAFGWVA